MADKNSKEKVKRLSKGQRKHVRRMKQEARKEVAPIKRQSQPAPVQPAPKQKKDDDS